MNNTPSKPENEPTDEFWDLGDDDLELEKSTAKEPVKVAPTSVTAEKSSPPEEPDALSETPMTEQPASSPAPELTRVRVSSSEKSEPRPTTMGEKILLGIVVLCLAGLAAWGVFAFYSSADNREFVDYTDDFPIAGTDISIAAVETWWREPVRDGDNPDVGVVAEAKLIPCAKIKLAESKTTTIQVSFRDGDDNLIGDTLNLSVKDGKFLSAGSDEIDIHATAGFTSPSFLNPYINGDISPWSIAIVEGDRSDSPLVRSRVKANYKEIK